MAGAIPVQTQEDIVPPAPVALSFRLAGILLAPAVAVTVQLILTGPFGLTLQIPEAPGSTDLQELPLLTTALLTFGLGIAGWVLVILLERFGADRGRRIWTLVALGVFAVSLLAILPLDVAARAQWGLVAVHASVALALIPSMVSGPSGSVPAVDGEATAAEADEVEAADKAEAAGH